MSCLPFLWCQEVRLKIMMIVVADGLEVKHGRVTLATNINVDQEDADGQSRTAKIFFRINQGHIMLANIQPRIDCFAQAAKLLERRRQPFGPS